MEYVVGGRYRSTPKPVNENVDAIAALKFNVQLNDDQRSSLTAKTLADIFIWQIQRKKLREKKRSNQGKSPKSRGGGCDPGGLSGNLPSASNTTPEMGGREALAAATFGAALVSAFVASLR